MIAGLVVLLTGFTTLVAVILGCFFTLRRLRGRGMTPELRPIPQRLEASIEPSENVVSGKELEGQEASRKARVRSEQQSGKEKGEEEEDNAMDAAARWPIDNKKFGADLPATDSDASMRRHDSLTGAPAPDPVDYCGHIQREIKRTQQRVALSHIEAAMTAEQRDAERAVQRKQMEEICRLMEEEKEKFGFKSVDEVQEQMKLYVQ